MTALLIISIILLVAVCVSIVFTVLVYIHLSNLVIMTSAYQSQRYTQSVSTVKDKKPFLPPVKESKKGRTIRPDDDLVDIADLPWEEGYKVMEEVGNGKSA